jgi:hypothetical protein
MSTIVNINTQLHVAKFGLNPSTAAADAVQDEGGAIVINTVAKKIRIKAGGDVGDVAAGAGAEAITVYGVDGDWNFVSEIIITKGASVSELSVNDYLYVYRAHVSGSGSVFNIDDIIIENVSAVVMATITDNYGQTERAVFPVFAGYELYLNKFRFEGVGTPSLNGEIALVCYTLDQGQRIIHSFPFAAGSMPAPKEWDKNHKVVPEKSLVYAKLISISAGTPIIGASFDGDLYKR